MVRVLRAIKAYQEFQLLLTAVPSFSRICPAFFNVYTLFMKNPNYIWTDGRCCQNLQRFFIFWPGKDHFLSVYIFYSKLEASPMDDRCSFCRCLKLEICCDNYMRDFSYIFLSVPECYIPDGEPFIIYTFCQTSVFVQYLITVAHVIYLQKLLAL